MRKHERNAFSDDFKKNMDVNVAQSAVTRFGISVGSNVAMQGSIRHQLEWRSAGLSPTGDDWTILHGAVFCISSGDAHG